MNRFRPYYRFLLDIKWYFIGAILCGIVYASTAGALPLLLKKILPALFPSENHPIQPLVFAMPEWLGIGSITIPPSWILPLAISMLPLNFAIRGISHFYNTYLINYCGIRVLEHIRLLVFKKIQKLHLGFFHKNKSGDLMSRLTNDTNDVKNVIVDVSNDFIRQPFTLIAMVISLIWMAFDNPEIWKLLIALASVPLCILPIRFIGKRIRKRSRETLNQAGNLLNRLNESLNAPKEIRSYNLEQEEINEFQKEVKQYFGLQMKVVKYGKMLAPTIEFVGACAISFAVFKASQAKISLNDIAAVVTALYLAYDPIKALGTIHNKIQQGTSALDRIEEVLHAPVDILDPENPLPFESANGNIDFEHVSFHYDPEEAILQNINLQVKAGEVIALVGPSGAGKSTIANLIPRFYDVTDGSIKIDSKDVRNIRQHELRAQIASVSQEPILFNDTIFNNIRMGKLDATDDEIHEAARKAFAYDFIMQTEDGFQTIVGEKGTRLSGGQKQRIAIARAFLKNAPILILDEATSALDSESEAKIQSALETLVHGKTTFIIAHRFSTIKIADRIVVLERGKMIAQGTHEKVYSECLLYKALYDQQNAD